MMQTAYDSASVAVSGILSGLQQHQRWSPACRRRGADDLSVQLRDIDLPHPHRSVWRFADTIPVRTSSKSRHLRQLARLHESGFCSCLTTCACTPPVAQARLLRAMCDCGMPTHPGVLMQWDCSVSCEVRLKAAAGGGIKGSCVDDEGDPLCCVETRSCPICNMLDWPSCSTLVIALQPGQAPQRICCCRDNLRSCTSSFGAASVRCGQQRAAQRRWSWCQISRCHRCYAEPRLCSHRRVGSRAGI